MKDLKEFNIPFVGLKEGKHLFQYKVDNTFFELYNYNEFEKSSINVTLEFVKKSTLFELEFTASGTVNVPCDVTNEYFDLEITATLPLVVKFGQEYNDENEEILILPHEVYQFSVAQFIYEMIVLGIPNKRVHPKVLDGTMETEALEQLEIKEEKTVETTDPRWDKLKNLITEKKT
ncbi:DUF177 domain-containing protein [uncultured Polaribacter sp.]|jgi:uncharacterized metal-binding protein YceD (DUF177 family)|uniref:YceD family protein n=1 Tax=uncultured Polaribacter sp. TaxID=174711 RepID=UPI0030DD68BE|tara:strand:- start:1434 stop:1961 length:528 start_codon:yes stop_codon:yes gene_type:complete